MAELIIHDHRSSPSDIQQHVRRACCAFANTGTHSRQRCPRLKTIISRNRVLYNYNDDITEVINLFLRSYGGFAAHTAASASHLVKRLYKSEIFDN